MASKSSRVLLLQMLTTPRSHVSPRKSRLPLGITHGMPVSQDLMQQDWCLLVFTVSALNILPKPYTVLPSHGLSPTKVSIMTGIPIQPLVPTTISARTCAIWILLALLICLLNLSYATLYIRLSQLATFALRFST
jgi:hypothetical protein